MLVSYRVLKSKVLTPLKYLRLLLQLGTDSLNNYLLTLRKCLSPIAIAFYQIFCCTDICSISSSYFLVNPNLTITSSYLCSFLRDTQYSIDLVTSIFFTFSFSRISNCIYFLRTSIINIKYVIWII